jgi:hypothetical protein
MSKDEAITILLQDIADYDRILERLREGVAGRTSFGSSTA